MHPAREAICRCPQCRRYFCRECITEHGGEFVCSACLQTLTRRTAKSDGLAHGWLVVPVLGSAALLAAWFFFYNIGQIVLSFVAPKGMVR